MPRLSYMLQAGYGEILGMASTSGNETSTEARARMIFESESHPGVTWYLVPPENRKPGTVTQIVLSELAKDRYRELAKKELGY